MATVYTSLGETKIVDLIDGTSAVHLAAANATIAWGTGAGTADKADTALFTEASEARVAVAETQPSADKNQWTATITANGAKTITNAGLFDAAGANCIIHGDFTGIVVALNDQIAFTITLEQT
jgi:hypothetical protein